VSGEALIILIVVLAVLSLAGILALLAVKPAASPQERLAGLESSTTRDGKLVIPSDEEEEKRRRMAERLIQAGFYRRNSPGYYLFTKTLMAGIPVVLGLLSGLIGLVPLVVGVVLGGITGLLGTLLPSLWLDAKKRKRQTDLRRALPDALDLIVVCVEAGLSVPAAIARVAKELRTAYPMLAIEMTIVERETQMGATCGVALRRFAERFDLEELRSLASVIQQAEKFGASIKQALRVHAEGLRTKRFQMAEERAQKASIKLLFPTLFFIFPSLYVVLLGPAVLDIYKFLVDQNLLFR
jgi:tight adherence protein C